MATRRIKEITNTATTFASDDFIALDGTSQGTRKMDKDDLIAEVSAGVSGDYLEEANNLSDVASLDTSKLNMEIPDVGTAPNEVPLSGQLGTMAFQDSAGVSVGQLEADEIGVGVTPSGNPLEVAGTNGNFSIAADGNTANFSRNAANYIAATADTSSALAVLAKHSFQVHTGNPTVEALRVDSSQRVGIGTASPGSYDGNADDLVVETGGHTGITVRSSSASNGAIYFADGTSGDERYRGYVVYNHANNQLQFGSAAATQWVINSSGDFVSQGGGIDFGSGASTTLDAYEEGSFTPNINTSGGTINGTTTIYSARYTKIGNTVHIAMYVATDGLTDVSSASGYVRITGLPFTAAGSGHYGGLCATYAADWSSAPLGGYVATSSTVVALTKRYSSITGAISTGAVSDLNTSGGTKNSVILTGHYEAA